MHSILNFSLIFHLEALAEIKQVVPEEGVLVELVDLHDDMAVNVLPQGPLSSSLHKKKHAILFLVKQKLNFMQKKQHIKQYVAKW